MKFLAASMLMAVFTTVLARSASAQRESSQDYAYNSTCMDHLRGHIRRELEAAITYLAMGSWANQYDVQRPGLANFFFHSAKEEREHAFTLLSYLRMRGHNELDILPASLEPINKKYEWESPISALRQALTMEKQVTEHIKRIIDYCADAEDHHLADYLTGEFMEEQLKGQRKLAGHINTLNRLLTKQPRLANYLFDKELN